ncbi:Fanconi anemia group J protein homolog isoform X2 [Ceratina calcarata]|uniref:Fanconi anemia group J protein homolog isoform X2 n=1 Tax=Ceratina calcarata TaxID=156304 RepID=A0AAJ7N354_9HYME|nr:Fanconi anemia group J protein homolog isoform X2 [Ceratina calcarata]
MSSTQEEPIVIDISSDEEPSAPKRMKMAEVIEGKTLTISGVKVQFPLPTPYKCQIALMSRVIEGCKKSQHCLLESPTGSGKTLALLCSSLAWQDWYHAEVKEQSVCNNVNTATGTGQKGISLSDLQSVYDHKNVDFENDKCGASVKIRVPKIFYGTRTHRQISQVVKELKRTVYKNKKMVILSSREQSCIQKIEPDASEKNKTDLCRRLLDNEGCKYYTEDNKSHMSTFAAAEKLGLPRVWDIEDLNRVARCSESCAYYAARDLMNEAEIVFCPYNYLIDPNVREAMHLSLTDHVIILDEAHNIEDTCSDAGSIVIIDHELEDIIRECKSLKKHLEKYTMYGVIENFVSRILKCIRSVELLERDRLKTEFAKFNCEQLVKLFNNKEMNEDNREEFKEEIKKALADSNKIKEEKPKADKSAQSKIMSLFMKRRLEKLLQFLEIIVSVECIDHYMVYIANDKQREQGYSIDSENYISIKSETKSVKVMKLLCLNPGLIFKQIAERARCIILTSGTLTPTDSFASELRTNFKYTRPGEHVIPRENVYVNCVSEGPKNVRLMANYKNVKTWSFQKALGWTLHDICVMVPHGVLCFFSSYHVMEQMVNNWKHQQIWKHISKVKRVFIEPKGQRELEHRMHEFRTEIRATASKPVNGITGCLFLGVMRGKLAEGEDFKDEEARCVVTVGLPFMAINMELDFKMAYNDAHRSEGLLQSDEWYKTQTYRALNQALGRCIRHMNDWGAILLIDERFSKPANRKKLPKWVTDVFSKSTSPNSWRAELQKFIKTHETIADN